jgi:hypothetical protein
MNDNKDLNKGGTIDPALSTYTELRDIEIFSVGTHHNELFTEQDLDELVNNFNELKTKVKPILKIAHHNAMHKTDGQPALGWTTDLKRIGSKLIASFADVPKIVFDAISKKLYKRVSSEIYQNLEIGGKKYKRVLAGVGLLGADIPEVKDLKDIEIFLTDNFERKEFVFCAEDGIIVSNKTNEVKKMDDELKKKYEEEIARLKSDHEKEMKGKILFSESDLKKYTDKIGELQAELINTKKTDKVKEYKEFCEKMVMDGKMIPAARDILIADIDKLNFSETDGIVLPFAKFKSFMEKTKEILDKSEKGYHLPTEERKKQAKSNYFETKGIKAEGVELDQMAKEYALKNKVNYAEAISAVLLSNPELLEGGIE